MNERLTFLKFVLGPAVRANYLLGWDTIRVFGKHANEILTATRNDPGLETVGTQIIEQLQHRLDIGVRFPFGMLRHHSLDLVDRERDLVGNRILGP